MNKKQSKKVKTTSNRDTLEKLIRTFLDIYDLEGANFYETPRRYAKLWHDFLMQEKPILRAFPTDCKDLVVVKNFIQWGFCPHHLLPVRYTFKVGYIPNGKALGLSKIPRLAAWCLAKLPLQEDIPKMIVKELETVLTPLGAACQVEGYHLCCVSRGIKSESISFTNTSLSGIILMSPSTHQEFLNS